MRDTDRSDIAERRKKKKAALVFNWEWNFVLQHYMEDGFFPLLAHICRAQKNIRDAQMYRRNPANLASRLLIFCIFKREKKHERTAGLKEIK